MRHIDGIPDSEIIREYLGKFKNKFYLTQIPAKSPIDGDVNISKFIWSVNEDNAIHAQYSKSQNSILISHRFHSPHGLRWVKLDYKLINIADPKGMSKAFNYIKILENRCSSNRGS